MSILTLRATEAIPTREYAKETPNATTAPCSDDHGELDTSNLGTRGKQPISKDRGICRLFGRDHQFGLDPNRTRSQWRNRSRQYRRIRNCSNSKSKPQLRSQG